MKRGHGAEEVACWTSSLCSEDCAVEEPGGKAAPRYLPLPSIKVQLPPRASRLSKVLLLLVLDPKLFSAPYLSL